MWHFCALYAVAVATPTWNHPGPLGPLVSNDGTLYASTPDDCFGNCGVYALESAGTAKWFAHVKDGFMGRPVQGQDDSIYVVGSSTALWSIATNGNTKTLLDGDWDSQDTDPPAFGMDGTIYALNGTNLAAVDPKGSLKWKFNAGSAIRVSPAVGNDANAVYVVGMASPSANGNIYAVDFNGTLKWSMPIPGDGPEVEGLSVGPDGTIYLCVCTVPGFVQCQLDAVNPSGFYSWTYKFPYMAGVENSPIFAADGSVIIAAGQVLYSLDPKDGSDKWQFEGDNGLEAAPSIGPDGSVYIGSQPGQLYKLTAEGKLLWTYKPPCPELYGRPCCSDTSKPAIGKDNTVFMEVRVCKASWIYALTPEGNLSWKWAFNDTLLPREHVIV